MKGLGWAALVLGILVIVFAYVDTAQQVIQTILGILTAIVGLVGLTGK